MQNPAGGSVLDVLLSLFPVSVSTVFVSSMVSSVCRPSISGCVLPHFAEEKSPELSAQFPPAPAPRLYSHGMDSCDVIWLQSNFSFSFSFWFNFQLDLISKEVHHTVSGVQTMGQRSVGGEQHGELLSRQYHGPLTRA